jgi:hypothetical protein
MEPNRSPYLIITNGPTGSGKTGLVQKTINYYDLDPDYVTARIDDLVETNTQYKQGIDQIILQQCDNKFSLCDNLVEQLNNPSQEMLNQFGDLYLKIRKTKGGYCHATKSCDSVNDDNMLNAIKSGKNLVFETVGEYYVNWLIEWLKEQTSFTYHVYYTFTVLDFAENVRRNKTRASTQLKQYIENKELHPAPRLPDVTDSHMKKITLKVHQNLWDLMGKKLFGQLPDVHYIIVFDNSGKKSDIRVLYDSATTTSMGDLVCAIERIKSIRRLRRCYLRSN